MIRDTGTTAWNSAHDGSTTNHLADILDEYLQSLEAGQPLSREQVLKRYPQYAEALQEYLDDLQWLHGRTAVPEPLNTGLDGDSRTLGDFEIVREIGRGGMGVVYEARQRSLHRRVAIKVLPFVAMLDDRQIMRFENEARAAAQLHHPHIVPVYGVGCDRGVRFYAMQFIEGLSLRQLIDAGNAGACGENVRPTSRSQIREVARLGVQAANALSTAHECGVVHRDVKPSNLLVDQQGQLWITDFGLARCQSNHDVTRSGDILGTLHYMSPEQARGEANITDPRTDVYSLAVTLYEWLAHRRPFEFRSQPEVLRHIEQGECKPVHHWNRAVPRDLSNVIAKAMRTNPADRYQDAAALEADLQRFLDGEPTRAKPPSVIQVLSKWSARNRTAVVSGLLALLVLSIALAAMNIWLWGQKINWARKDRQASERIVKLERNLETFGLQAADVLKSIPGSQEERRTLLRDMLDQYQEVLDGLGKANTASLRTDAAITHTKMATVYRELDDNVAALAAYHRAADRFAELANSGPRKSWYKAQQAKCLSSGGLIQSDLGHSSLAIFEIERAIAIQDNLLDESDDVDHAVALAQSMINLGTVKQRTGANVSDANDSFQQVMDRLDAALDGGADDARILATLANLGGHRCTQLVETDASLARHYARLAVDYGQRLETIAVDGKHRSQLAADCSNLAALLAEVGELEEAVQSFQLAAQYQREADCRDDLVTTLCNLAKTQLNGGQKQDAIETYREAVAVQRSLLNASPGDLNHVSRLGGIYNNLAYLWQASNRLALADETYEMAGKYQQRAFELAPHITQFRDDLSRTWYNHARVSQLRDKPERAAELQARRAELWPNHVDQLNSAAKAILVNARRMPTVELTETWTSHAHALMRQCQRLEGMEEVAP